MYVKQVSRYTISDIDFSVQKTHNVPMTEKIRIIRESKGLTRDQLAKRMGISHSQVTKLERGERRLTTDWLHSLADALEVSPVDLLDNVGKTSVQVPVMAWVSAGALISNEAVEMGNIEIAGLSDGDWIALRVQGSSMDRISPPDSIIVVNRRDRRLVANGCYVIADEDGKATYKRYRPNPMRFEPVSTDPTHEPLFPDQEPLIVGRAKMSILEL